MGSAVSFRIHAGFSHTLCLIPKSMDIINKKNKKSSAPECDLRETGGTIWMVASLPRYLESLIPGSYCMMILNIADPLTFDNGQ